MNELLLPSSLINSGDWWKGDELIALDNDIFTSRMTPSKWIDRNGVPFNAYNVQTDPIPVTDHLSPFGGGISLLSNGIVTTASQIPITKLQSDWTLDYWTCEPDGNVANARQNYYFIQFQYADNSYTNRLLACFSGPDVPGRVHVWNNTGSVTVSSVWNVSAFYSIPWIHVTVMYEAATGYWRFFKNGVYINRLTRKITTVTGGNQTVGVRGRQFNGRTFIDRYRLREGMRFDVAGFNIATIYD